MLINNEIISLKKVNSIQSWFKKIKRDMNRIIERLAIAGFENVYFKHSGAITYCYAIKSKNYRVVLATAELAEDDLRVDLLGKYLSLARVADEILYSSKETETYEPPSANFIRAFTESIREDE